MLTHGYIRTPTPLVVHTHIVVACAETYTHMMSFRLSHTSPPSCCHVHASTNAVIAALHSITTQDALSGASRTFLYRLLLLYERRTHS